MSDDEKKYRYKKIVYRLRVISNQIYQFDDEMYRLKRDINNNLMVNNKGYGAWTVGNQRDTLTGVRSNINNTIIPSLNKKIYN